MASAPFRLAAAVAAVTLSFPAQSFAKCAITNPAAQLCQSGAGAAVAFLRTMPNRINDDGMEKLLKQSGCKTAGDKPANRDIREIARGPVHLAERSIEVLSVLIDQTSYWYIAAESIEGVCDLAKPN